MSDSEATNIFITIFSLACEKVVTRGWTPQHIDIIYRCLCDVVELEHVPELLDAYETVKTQLVAFLEKEA